VYRQIVAMLLMMFVGLAHAMPACNVSSAPANFGEYDETVSSPLDSSSGSITVTCSDSALAAPRSMYYEIKLGPGGGGGFAPRFMINGAFSLGYFLYRSAAFNPANVWGDGASGAAFPLAGCITVPAGGSPSAPSVHVVNGRMLAGQLPVNVGTYADTLSVSMVLYGDCGSGTSSPSTLVSAPPLAVQANVVPKCVIATGPYTLNFGDYTRGAGPKVGDVKIGVTCPLNLPYSIGFSGLSGGVRLLTNAGNSIEYNLYSDAGMTTVVGDTERVDTIEGVGTGLRVNTTVYGRLPDSIANQAAPPGAYTAIVTITVFY
jgi:spore coat protein U-like protein